MTSGVAWFAAAAVLALLLSFHKTLSGVIAGIGGAVGSLMTLAAGGVVLIDGQSVDTLIPLIHHAVELTPLNAIWLITFGLCGLFISLFNIDWHRHQHTKANGLLVNLLMAAAVCTVIASNLGALVVMAEIMALCGVFLTGCSASGKLWFALGRLGTLLLALACWLVWQRFGTLDFAMLNGQPLGNDVWTLGVVGFGLLAGIIPLHGWVPQAHANASAPAAALFSTVVMKVGLFGILMITLTGGQPPLWWGVALLIAGMITAFVGGLYALMEHNIQRLLAYHTLENIGIILLGMGAGVTGLALNQPALIAAGFIGGLYHLINHSLFKSTLFLGAGSVWFRTGHRDIEKLGGIGKKMPVISLAMLVGLMAMAALPPLNGFAGEWVIYQSFFALGQSEAMLGVLVEPILLLGLWVAAQVAGSTHISFITDTVYHWPVSRSLPLVLALCACAFATFIEMGKLPFDLAEAEQELQEGPLTEYSGYGFAVLKWGISLKQLVVLQMFVGVFFPWGQMTHFSAGGLLLAVVVAVLKLLIGVLVIALFENSMARLRFVETSRITWAGFGFAFLAFVSLLVA
nr:formate hydrogenlyase subunit 3 [Enterobacter hormaechei]